MKVTPMELNMVYRKQRQLMRQTPGTAMQGAPVSILSARRRQAPASGGRPKPGSQEKQGLLVQTCREFLPVFEKSFDFPHLLVLTDAEGVVVQRWGDERSIRMAAREGVYAGECLALDVRGVNAFSVAMTLGRAVCLDPAESEVETLKEWNAFVFPIRGPRKKADGYFGFLFPDKPWGPGVGPFLNAIALKMEQQYAMLCKTAHAGVPATLEERLGRFGLTARECQVASYWVRDFDYKQISKAIGISENTVRVIVGRINGKLNVNSKASMILRLFDAI